MRLVYSILGIVLLTALIVFGVWTARPKGDIVIGAILPLTGDFAIYGGRVGRGIGLAMEEINGEGGVMKGRQLVVDVEDSSGDPDQGLRAAEMLIAERGVTAIIGGMSSQVTLAIAPAAEESRTVLLSPASSAPEISSAGDFVFRNYPSDTLQAELTAEYAFSQDCSGAGLLTTSAADGVALGRAFRTTFLSLGGRIVYDDDFAEPKRDFSEEVRQLGETSPDCVFIVGYNRELRAIVTQAREEGITARFYSPVIFHDEESIASGGASVEGVVFAAPAFDRGSSSPHIEEFTTAYREKFEEEADIWAAHGHDAVHLLVEAMRSHGTGGEEIRDGLYAITSYEGIAGETTFDENGDVRRPGRFVTVEGGRFLLLQE